MIKMTSSSSSSSPQSSTTSYSQQQNNKKSILLVDDEPDIIEILKVGLEDNGFKVDAFTDPQEALSSFKASAYDLLLLDVRMPKLNGFELYEQIKKIDNNNNNKAKVCYITAYEINYEKIREEFPSLEVSCFIKKPIEIQDLVRRINAELE
jgi:two-component system, OmpR family, response regulator ChvI